MESIKRAAANNSSSGSSIAEVCALCQRKTLFVFFFSENTPITCSFNKLSFQLIHMRQEIQAAIDKEILLRAGNERLLRMIEARPSVEKSDDVEHFIAVSSKDLEVGGEFFF